MGIDLHNLALLGHAQDRGASFARTIGIGRQALFIEAADLERHRALRGLPALVEPTIQPGRARYFEPLMQQWFAATTVDSVDASPYEEASLLHDMNLPWPPEQAGLGSYDAVLDFGCLEHVFDFPVAWRNCVSLCRIGGHILHSLPANNLSGHGFYQFSPELFFNLYQAKNGFELVGLWFAQKADPKHWWKVADPAAVKRRVTLRNAHEVYMLVLAKKLAEVGPMPAPQQSDYAQQEWLKAADAATLRPAGRSGVARALASLGWLDAARAGRERLRAIGSSGLGLPAPDYERVVVADLLRRGASR
jgi:SAM-dependent methyltransferase